MMPKDFPPDGLWARKLTAIFGTQDWKSRFYGRRGDADLFGDQGAIVRIAGADEIFKYFIERLRSRFAGVVEHPMLLENTRHTPMYALCFAAGNPKGAPTAIPIATHLTRP